MRNKFFHPILLLWLLLFSFKPSLIAQHTVSRVVYLSEMNLDDYYGAFIDLTGRAELYFNTYESLFVHAEVAAESRCLVPRDCMKGMIKGDPEGFPVYINRKEEYLYYKTYAYSVARDTYFVLKEDLPQIAWEITDQTKQLDGLFCINAYGEFGGRVYDVWFTPDIPVPLGPYKLGGLPGLILQAKSRDGRVAYEFVSYESSVEEHPPIAPPKIGRYVIWEELEEFLIAKLLRVESRNTATHGATLVDPPENYTIEKGKFKIYSEYKARRRRKE